MNPGRLLARLLWCILFALKFALCGCAYRATEDAGTFATGMAIGVVGCLLFGAVFGDRR